jgi:hypothetical protein
MAVRYRFALDELRSLEGNSRLASQAIAHAERERFERVAATLASVFLLPTLFASIYGANVALPAKNNWWGFAVLTATIVVLGLLGWVLMRKRLRPGHAAEPSPGATVGPPAEQRTAVWWRLLRAT